MESIDVLIITFRAAGGAELFFENMQALQRGDKIAILDAALVTKDSLGEVTVTETKDLDAGAGALAGAVTGALMGLIGGPVSGLIGLVAGATAGGLTAEGFDFGIPDDMVDDFEDALIPGSSALLTLLDHDHAEFVKTLPGTLPLFEDTRIFQHTISGETVEKIKKAKRKEKPDET